MMPDGIKLFILAAKHRNITQAARELHITQSAASRRVKQLEDRLQIKLFKKNGRGTELTAAGEIFLNRLLPISDQLDALEKSYSPDKNSITIAASYRPSKYLLPELMTEFRRKHPIVKLALWTNSSDEIEKLLLVEGKVDLAITNKPSVSPSTFVREPYFTEPLTPFVAADHPLARMKSLRDEEAGTIPVILKSRREGESRVEALLRELEKDGFKFETVVRCDSPEVLKKFVRQGAGVGFLYYNSIKQGIGRGYFKVLQFPGLDLVGENFIVYPKEKPLSALATEFLSFLRASVTKAKLVLPVTHQRSNGRMNGQGHDAILGSKLPSWVITIAAFDWTSSLEWLS